MDWSLEGMAALAAVVDEGSFAAAGARLHKVPSAVSYQIQQLERALGVQLFDRSGHRAVLTPVGQAVLDEGRFLLARARRIDTLARQFDAGWEARLQVVVDGSLDAGPLLEALTRLGEAGVPTHVQLRTEFRWGVPERFAELDADVMITMEVPDDPLLVVDALDPVHFVLVVAPDHPAAGRGPVPLARLQRHLELSVHDSARLTARRDTNLLPGARVFYVGDFAAKRAGLLRGLGLGWMPVHAVAADLEAGRLVELDVLPSARRTFPLAMVTRLDRPLGRAGQQLTTFLRTALSAAPPGPAAHQHGRPDDHQPQRLEGTPRDRHGVQDQHRGRDPGDGEGHPVDG
jgi:DNA-binding transcriptional LysR family regulator